MVAAYTAYIFFLALCGWGQCNGLILDVSRRWQTYFLYNDARNWNTQRVPCDADAVILPYSPDIELKLPEGNTIFRDVELSSNSMLVLPTNGVVQFSGMKYTPNCDGKDAVFKQVTPSNWTDPHNWDGWNEATPDLERIACASQSITFRHPGVFKVFIPGYLKLAFLEVGRKHFGAQQFGEYFAQEDNYEFKSSTLFPFFERSSDDCYPDVWCECGNDYLRSQVCTVDCPVPLCKQPVQPAGFCCPVCGAYFLMGDFENVNVKEFNKTVNDYLEGKDVIWYASRVEDSIQVVLVAEGEYSEEVPEIAAELKTYLTHSNSKWIIKNLFTSGHVWYPATFGQVIGHLFSLLVVVLLVFASIIVFYSHNWSRLSFSWLPQEGRPFVFARFENQTGEVVVASEECQPPESPPQAFTNPMYGSTDQESNITVENPVYSELNDSKDEPFEEGISLETTDINK